MSEAFRDISPDAPELQPIISGLFAEYAARYGDYFSRDAEVTFNLVGGAAEAVLSEVANIRERFIKRVLRKIMVLEIAPKIVQRIFDGNQRRGSLVLTFRILGVIPDDDADALEDMQLVRGALICAELAFDILIKCLRLGQRFLMGKNGIGVACG